MAASSLPDLMDIAGAINGAANAVAAGDFRGPVELNPPGFRRAKAKVYFPNQYETRANWPLVVLLHALTGTAEIEDLYFSLRFRASRRGFILVTPEGTKMPPGSISPENKDYSGKQFWNATDVCCDLAKTGVDDVKYLNDLIDYLARHYRVDTKRIYLFGHSNGAFMANRLACENGRRFAAIANLAGGSFKNPADCRRPVAVPYLQIHSVNDNVVVYRHDDRYAAGLPTVRQWLAKNQCSPKSEIISPNAFLPLLFGPSVQMRAWKNCASRMDVTLWTIPSYSGALWNPHVPLLTWAFSEEILDYLFAHHR